jgi:DNA (cytosine-5)-methyltransferase 1
LSLRVGTAFSGIGGFDLAFENAGMELTWAIEIDPAARAVMRDHWPQLTIYEDIKEVRGVDVARVDVLCGGFPCQDLSVAGRRAGLAGERSGLFYEFARLADELRPAWLVIENVPGLLSSNGGRDMGAVLGTLAELGYGYAYRVLDAQYFGVAQRRRRVFIVGNLGGGELAAQVLFEPESSERNSPPRRQARPRIAASLTAGTGVSGNDPGRRREDDINLVAGTLAPGAHPGGFNGRDAERDQLVATTVPVITAAAGSNHMSPRHNRDELMIPTVSRALSAPKSGMRFDPNGEDYVVSHALKAEGADGSEDGTGRGVPMVVSTLQGGGRRGYRIDSESAGGGQLIPVPAKPQ